MNGNFACDPVIHIDRKVLLHAAKLGHGTDSFTSPPKEGMLRYLVTLASIWSWSTRSDDKGHGCSPYLYRCPYLQLKIIFNDAF
jgi:hypothetical protein